MNNAFLIILSILLSGCVTAKDPARSFTNTNVGVPDHKRAVLVLYRNMAPPLIHNSKAFINGKPYTNLPLQSFTWLYVDPGKYNIKIKILSIFPSGAEKELQIEAGEYYFAKIVASPRLSGNVVYNAYDINIGGYDEKITELIECCRFVPKKY
ncbi:MAG: DUF2846 domain-containing protein [Cellvibrionaceae bacterium]|nr:DUF2846 domain-containing protein [Cellvibrionaceae bacterium]